ATYKELLVKKELQISTLEMSVQERKNINLNKLENEIANLEKKLSLEAEKIGLKIDKNQDLSWKDVKKQLKDGEIVLEITRIKYFDKQFTDSSLYLVLKIDKNSNYPEAVLLPYGKYAENEIYNLFRNSIIFNKPKQKETYEAFWKPLEKFTQNATRIYWAGDGVLSQINPELLHDGENFLIDKFDFIFLSGSRDLLKPAPNYTNFNRQVAIIANPKFYMKSKNPKYSVADLPGTLSEAKSIYQLLHENKWNSFQYLEENALEANIKNLQGKYDVIHFATHGFFLEDTKLDEGISEEILEIKAINNPMMRSGILLAGAGDLIENQSFLGDGILTAQELANMDFSDTKIAILSACETARGEVTAGEGVFGLQRSILMAGISNIIMSLFKVDDAATAELMTEFYKSYLHNPSNPHQAFKNAKKTIRDKYQKPIYWGAFILLGK
ncbi:MAG: CHAT domain-containing protein, partial [Raineya sp.]